MINQTIPNMPDMANKSMLYCIGTDAQQLVHIKHLLADQYELCEFSCIEDAQAELNGKNPNLILCHLSCLNGDASSLFSIMENAVTRARVLIIGPKLSVIEQISILKQGARGYFQEELVDDKLLIALDLIQRGEVWVERHVIAGLIDELNHTPQLSNEQQAKLDSLSRKELEVAELVSHGATNKMIARTMNITERTVKAHLTAIFQKMNIPDRLSLAIFFRDLR
ncbi:putative DNA-binding response regulator, LuxR family [Methylophaga aminisulfidivorans MP]|uniref:DNA-binding response regulator n=2 Tax=Methylophaga TaxID=40222 RepID=A0ABQ5TR40_9GAMM|nr:MULTISPECIES: response regulator transcription factor [Methylophaga]EGL56009.1 putative DNA-binding response regulator, LuxR family [Methylophaga aminisulfidivorans MP]GLP98310.1 DNA-binding response regulator [Methylophaga thalassica]